VREGEGQVAFVCFESVAKTI